jgi:hypothetical protein
MTAASSDDPAVVKCLSVQQARSHTSRGEVLRAAHLRVLPCAERRTRRPLLVRERQPASPPTRRSLRTTRGGLRHSRLCSRSGGKGNSCEGGPPRGRGLGWSDRVADFHSPWHSPGHWAPLHERAGEVFRTVSKTVDGGNVVRGFESLPLRFWLGRARFAADPRARRSAGRLETAAVASTNVGARRRPPPPPGFHSPGLPRS